MSGPAPLVVSGPSGAGKSTLLRRMMEQYKDVFGLSVSHTTRSARAGEQDGREYNFVTKTEMEAAIDNGDFIEFATFAGNMYGTSKAAVERVRGQGLICILDIEAEGVRSMKASQFQPNYVFITAPNMEVLEERLRKRGTETEESLQKRLARAVTDIKFGEEEGNFDLYLVNDDLETAYRELEDFLKSRYSELK